MQILFIKLDMQCTYILHADACGHFKSQIAISKEEIFSRDLE